MIKEFNTYGERLYKDINGVKCNLRGMLKREPEWVISRFKYMEVKIEELEQRITEDSIAGVKIIEEKNATITTLDQKVGELQSRVTLLVNLIGELERQSGIGGRC